MVDAEKLLKSLDVYDNYRPSALDYQRFDDGSLHMIPFQFELEFIWYNKALLQKAGVSVPKSLDDIPAMCTALRERRHHPHRHRRPGPVAPGAVRRLPAVP